MGLVVVVGVVLVLFDVLLGVFLCGRRVFMLFFS